MATQAPVVLRGCQQRGFAEAAVVEQFDWDKLGKAVTSDEGKRELSILRTTFFEYQSRILNVPVGCQILYFEVLIAECIGLQTPRACFAGGQAH